jgi:excisionase family DNA binding protein
MLTFCMRSTTGLIIVSPAPRGGDWILPNLNTMPCSNCCTTRTDRPAAITPSTTGTATTITMASTIATSPPQASRAGYGPGPATDLMPARGRRRCLLIRTTPGGSSSPSSRIRRAVAASWGVGRFPWHATCEVRLRQMATNSVQTSPDGPDRAAERLAYSVDEAAHLTGLSRDLLYEQMRRGNLSYVKVGRRRLITRQHLERFLGLP